MFSLTSSRWLSGGKARWAQSTRSQSRQFGPIGVAAPCGASRL